MKRVAECHIRLFGRLVGYPADFRHGRFRPQTLSVILLHKVSGTSGYKGQVALLGFRRIEHRHSVQ